MNVQSASKPAQVRSADAFQAARALGDLLAQTPEYRAFIAAFQAVNNDPTVRQLASRMRACQTAIEVGRNVGQNIAELERLEAELESIPVVQAYRRAEEATRAIFRAVDDIISREAGVDFAAHAKRSCCG